MADDDWESPFPGRIVSLDTEEDWQGLKEYCADDDALPLVRCLEVARASGARSVIIETRYIDPDYRSEYSAFYSRAFESIPSTTRRLHFFRAALSDEQLWCLPAEALDGYVGYVVLRPTSFGGVGRTMLVPPPGLRDAVRTSVLEHATLFGQRLEIQAVPFMEQDAQLDRCAHAAAWVAHYSAYRRGEVTRRPVAAFSLNADPSLGFGRPFPSDGLTVQQMLELLRQFELPAKFYDVNELPEAIPRESATPGPADVKGAHAGYWDTRLFGVCCRYLNSGFPVIVNTDDHAFVLCGYDRQPRTGSPDWIRFVRQDDQAGPYIPVTDIFNDVGPTGHRYSPWQYLIVPLPEKVWVLPEFAEAAAVQLLQKVASVAASAKVEGSGRLLELLSSGDLALHTYARLANDFKGGLDGRVDDAALREYRIARFPRYVWVVEAVDRKKRRARDENCVLGEVIFDATSVHSAPAPLAIHVPGFVMVFGTDGSQRMLRCAPADYRTGGVGPV